MAAADSMAESPAITRLGHLFKLTEVYLWENAAGVNKSSKNYNRDCPPEDEAEVSLATVDTNSPRKQTVDDRYSYIEDWELACQMDALGLPVSFSTSKEKKSMTTSGKKKGTRVKSLSSDNPVDNAAPTVPKVSEWENIGPSRVCYDYKSIPCSCKATEGYSEASNCKVEEVPEQISLHGLGEECVQGYICSERYATEATALTLGEIVNIQVCDEMIDETRSDYIVRETKCSDIASQSNAEFMENDFLGNEIKGAICEPCQEGQSYKKDDEKRYLGFSSISCDITRGNCGSIDIKTQKPSIRVELSLSDHGIQNSDNSIHLEYGDWKIIWDAFYMRNYFYNVKTQESTWYPPSGLEDFAFSSSPYAEIEEGAHELQDINFSFQEKKNDDDCINQTLKDISSKTHNAIEKEVSEELDIRINLDKQEQNVVCREAFNVPDFSLENLTNKSMRLTMDEIRCNDNIENQVSTTDELDNYYGIATTKKKKRVRRLQSQHTLQGVIEGLSTDIIKYWSQRYLLFSHFDKGIKMDEEGWFSVTPEPIARHHASRCGSGTIIDCFTGVGGNAIQFAMKSNHVIAIDIDPQKVDYAQHNAAIYGVANQIDFIIGDFFQMAQCLKGETAFMSPPWGGPDYAKVEIYDISTMLKPRDGYFLFKLSRMIASRLVMFLPRNVNLNQLAELALSVEPPWSLEVEKNFLNGKLKAITAYFEMR